MDFVQRLRVFLVPVGDQTELTGRTWERFAAQDPEVASIYAMDLAVLGIIWAAFGLLAAIVSVGSLPPGGSRAWYALWAGSDHVRRHRHPLPD